MFNYGPTVSDNSGQILAQGQIGAASTKADTMKGLGKDIGGALASIGGMYGEIEGNKAKGRAFKDVFKVIAPSAGIDMKQLEALTGGSLKNDMDWYRASETFAPLLPSLINAQLGSQRLGVQQTGQQIQQNAPMARAAATAAGNAAAGQATVPPQNFGNINFGIVD